MGLFDWFRRKTNTPSSPPVSKKISPEAPTAPTERRAEPAAPIVSPVPKVDVASEAAKREAAERAWLASEREDMLRSMGISDPRTTKPNIQNTQHTERDLVAAVDKHLAELDYCFNTAGLESRARHQAASAALCQCINELAQLKTPKARLALERVRRSRCIYTDVLHAAKDALSKLPGLPCESCKDTQRPVRLWLDAPMPDLYICDDCIRAKGLDNSDSDAALPSVMPQLVNESQLPKEPGSGAQPFKTAIQAWNRWQVSPDRSHDRDEAATEYLKALQAGLTPPYEAASRSNLGQILLNQGRLKEALLQFKKTLFASPQSPDTAYDAAIRFAIISEELGATSQAQKAQAIAEIAASLMSSAISREAVERMRRIVREHRSKNVETVESRAQRLREDAEKTVFPGRSSGPTVVSSSQVGAAYGVQLIDDRALALIQSGTNACQSGDFNRALSAYKQALALEPRSVDAHNGLAGTYISLGKLDEAIKEHRIAIECSPAHVADKVQVVYVNMANAILKKGLRPAAVDEFRAGTQGLPQSSGYHCALGLIHWRTGDPRKARTEFQQVLTIDQSGICGQAAREWTEKIDRGESLG